MLYPVGLTIQCMRFAEDYANATDCILQETPYHTFLTTQTSSYISLESSGNTTPIRTDTRITIADGYRSYLADLGQDDGYLYPQLTQENGMTIIASEGALVYNRLVLGPLVLPYTLPGLSPGGTDPALFQPSVPAQPNNVQYWIWLVGPGVRNTDAGNYYDIKEVKISSMNNINYYLVLEASLDTPDILVPNIIN